MMLMKTIIKHSLSWAMAIIAMSSPLQHLIAQPVDQSEVTASPAKSKEVHWESQILDFFEAHKQSLGEVIDELRKQFNGIQIVTNGPVDKLQVNIELRSVSLKNIFRAIEINLSGQVFIEWEEDNTNMVAVVVELPPSEKAILKAFSMAKYLEQVRKKVATEQPEGMPDEVLTRIIDENTFARAQEETYEIVVDSLALLSDARGSSSKLDLPRLSFHPRSELMIVVGQTEAVEVVSQIIKGLNGDNEPSNSFGGRANP
jgi:hypothetical protein